MPLEMTVSFTRIFCKVLGDLSLGISDYRSLSHPQRLCSNILLTFWTFNTPHPGCSHAAPHIYYFDKAYFDTNPRLLLSMGSASGPQQRNTFVPPSTKHSSLPASLVILLGLLLEGIRPQFWVHQTPGDKCQAFQIDLLMPRVIPGQGEEEQLNLPCPSCGRSPWINAADGFLHLTMHPA